MRWFEREFAAYERSRKADTGKSSLEQLNEIAEQYQPEVKALCSFHICPGRDPLSGIHTPKAFSMDLILLRPRDT